MLLVVATNKYQIYMTESFKILTFEREDVEEGMKQPLRG